MVCVFVTWGSSPHSKGHNCSTLPTHTPGHSAWSLRQQLPAIGRSNECALTPHRPGSMSTWECTVLDNAPCAWQLHDIRQRPCIPQGPGAMCWPTMRPRTRRLAVPPYNIVHPPRTLVLAGLKAFCLPPTAWCTPLHHTCNYTGLRSRRLLLLFLPPYCRNRHHCSCRALLANGPTAPHRLSQQPQPAAHLLPSAAPTAETRLKTLSC